MKQFELYYQRPWDESFQPRHFTSQKPSGSIGEDAAQRVARLYSSGQSIESIGKEVGRARHFIVHVLQSKGLYGNRPIELHEASKAGAPVAGQSKEEPACEIPAGGVVDKPTTARSLRKAKSFRKPQAA